MVHNVGKLAVDDELYALIKKTAEGVGVDTESLLTNLGKIVAELAPENDRLVAHRSELQAQIDEYLEAHRNDFDTKEYEAFLTKIGYIVPEGPDFKVTTQNVDPEFTTPAPQLVCPSFLGEDPETNARYPLNAVNARWQSLYDSLYGKPGDKNLIGEEGDQGFLPDGYNPGRGNAVIAYANKQFDKIMPLRNASHSDVTGFKVRDGRLIAVLDNDRETWLQSPEKFAGYTGDPENPTSILFKNNGLHIEMKIDRHGRAGQHNKSGVDDVIMESALTTIIDGEDSIAAVDAADKCREYTNMVGLLRGDLKARIDGKGEPQIRTLAPDQHYTAPDGKEFTLCGRSKMLFRRVGHHMFTDAVTYDGKPIPEGLLDTLIIALGSRYDLQKKPEELRNSETGSVYIVMPKQHGPEEVALTVKQDERIEEAVGLPKNTLKIGIMDEEQRTSVNLKECNRAAKDRVVFINTGFLDRTGDLIHTAMQFGPMDTKAGIKAASWFNPYEQSNVQVGLTTQLHEAGQIGKGMWTENRNTDDVGSKIAQLQAGATTGWIPDPKFASLCALQNHAVNVADVQQQLIDSGNPQISKADILQIPSMPAASLDPAQKDKLLVGYCQSILGYVTPWVNEGTGCSSIPDFEGKALMEDRATLRIGSQLLANWLKHGFITEEELQGAMKRAAVVVDQQNAGKKGYVPLVGNYDGPAFQAAEALIHEGENSPNGYVEPFLHFHRQQAKEHGTYKGGDEVRYIKTEPTHTPQGTSAEPIGVGKTRSV